MVSRRYGLRQKLGDECLGADGQASFGFPRGMMMMRLGEDMVGNRDKLETCVEFLLLLACSPMDLK
jgi:hypothetical protein